MLRRALTLTFAAAAIAVGSSAPAAAIFWVERSVESASAENDLVALINAYRASNGLQAVVQTGSLGAAAGWMAGDMAARNYIGHVSSDGRSPTQRMSAFGYPATSMFTGEDLGAGYANAGAVFAGWQASPAHNAVLLNPNYNSIGVGVGYGASSTYTWYWAADFGGPGGTVKAIVPPPAPQVVAPAKPPTIEAETPQRVAAAARGAASPSADNPVDPDIAARAARAAFVEDRGARRVAHLFAVLLRMGAI